MAAILRIALIFTLSCTWVSGQPFSRQDSLRGGLRKERDKYRIHHLVLNLTIEPRDSSIRGFSELHLNVQPGTREIPFQIDLWNKYQIDSIVGSTGLLSYNREGNVLWIDDRGQQWIRVYYQGRPPVAVNPPWEGGFVWSRDGNGNPWISVACEGLGASSWWPLKDHLSEEPDSATLIFTIPAGHVCASNGTLVKMDTLNPEQTQWKFKVNCPLNSYNVSLTIGKLAKISSNYKSTEGGTLPLDFYVREEKYAEANSYLPRETARMLRAFEHYFGSYPCYSDGYGLVETPFWGMEHQGIIAYGNNYQKLKRYKFDFILVHESGHEWWGNSISCSDHSEMWIHEGFTTYSEALYVEYYQGYNRALAYLGEQRGKIRNTGPLLGPGGVNYNGWKDSDNYYKGTWFLNTLRHSFFDDTNWFRWIRNFCQQYRFRPVTTKIIQQSMEEACNCDLSGAFNQYLESTQIPELVINLKAETNVRWENTIPGFTLPVWLDHKRTQRIDPEGKITEYLSRKQLKNLESRYLINIRQEGLN